MSDLSRQHELSQDRAIKALRKGKASLRGGVVTAVSPLEVSVGGGSSLPAFAVDGCALSVNDQVSVIQQGSQVVVQGRLTDDPVDAGSVGGPFQPLDSDLTAIAALSTTSFGRALLTQADAAATRGTIGVVIGTDVQAYDSDLAAIAALSTTSFGRSLLTQANAAAALATIGAAASSHTHAQSDITSLVSDLALKAPLVSPALTGNPTAPTQSPGDSSAKLATTAYTDSAARVAALGLAIRNGCDYGTVQALDAHMGSGTGVLEASSNGTLLAALGLTAEHWDYSASANWLHTSYAVARDSSGNIYVTSKNGLSGVYEVVKFNSSMVYQTKFGSTGSGNGQFGGPCYGIAVDSSGNIYVADTVNSRVQKFNSSGTYQAQVGAAGSGNGQFGTVAPRGLAIDSSNNVFAVDTGNNRIQKFNSSLTYQSQFGASGSGSGQFSAPRGIAVDGSNNMFVTDSGNNRVQKFNSGGTYQSEFGTLGSGDGQFSAGGVWAIAVDSSSNIYVSDGAGNRIQKFNSSGVFQSKLGSTGSAHGQFNTPLGVAVDGSGNLFVADSGNNRTEKFTYVAATPIAVGQTVLVKDENFGGAHPDHGPYTITNAGSAGSKWKLTRRDDVDSSPEIMTGLLIQTWLTGSKRGQLWYCSTQAPITLNTTPLLFEEFVVSSFPLSHRDSHGPNGTDPLPLSSWTESWTAVSGGVGFTGTWSNFGSGYNDAAYYKDPFGIVHLRGFVKSGTIGTGIFTLPSGYRPASIEVHAIASNAAFGYLDISTAGVVRPLVGNTAWVSLDGITFRV